MTRLQTKVDGCTNCWVVLSTPPNSKWLIDQCLPKKIKSPAHSKAMSFQHFSIGKLLQTCQVCLCGMLVPMNKYMCLLHNWTAPDSMCDVHNINIQMKRKSYIKMGISHPIYGCSCNKLVCNFSRASSCCESNDKLLRLKLRKYLVIPYIER